MYSKFKPYNNKNSITNLTKTETAIIKISLLTT